VDGLPISDVLRFRNDEIRLIVRPSGTEPKLKIYYQVKGETGAKADEKMQQLIAFSKARLFS
jgi:phosphomannomutase